jgi:hypothetical protein
VTVTEHLRHTQLGEEHTPSFDPSFPDLVHAASTLADSWLASEIASALTCNELESLAVLIAGHGEVDGAVRWLCEHLEHDDHGDLHSSPHDLKHRLEHLGFRDCDHLVDGFLGLAVPLTDQDTAGSAEP